MASNASRRWPSSACGYLSHRLSGTYGPATCHAEVRWSAVNRGGNTVRNRCRTRILLVCGPRLADVVHTGSRRSPSAGSDTVFPLTVIQCKEPRVHVPCTALAGWLLVLKKCHSAHPLMGSIRLGVSGKTRPWEAGTEYCLVSDTWKLTNPVRKVEFNIAAGRFGAVVAASLQFL